MSDHNTRQLMRALAEIDTLRAEIERLTRALGEWTDCKGEYDGKPCISHLAYEDARVEIGQITKARDNALETAYRRLSEIRTAEDKIQLLQGALQSITECCAGDDDPWVVRVAEIAWGAISPETTKNSAHMPCDDDNCKVCFDREMSDLQENYGKYMLGDQPEDSNNG